MAECCTSDFSRQRALVVTNPFSVMMAAVMNVLDGAGPHGEADVKRLLVQLDQLADRGGVGRGARDEIRRATLDARQFFEAGDVDSAIERLRELRAAF
jgi:hypothetical protein